MTRSRLSTPGKLTPRYLFALGLLGTLAVVNYVMFRAEIREGEASASIQQVSGRHRLLFQQCAILAEELVLTTNAELRQEYRDRLSQLVNDLETTHYRLIQFDAPRNAAEELPDQERPTLAQSKVQHIYFDSPWLLDTEVRNYVAQIHALMVSEPAELSSRNPHLRYLRNVALSDRVTGALDAVVEAYQEQSETKTTQLRQAAYWSFLGTCLVLVFTGVFVFRPMARRVRHEMDAMEHLNQSLEQRVSERTALAEQHARELEESEAALRNQTRILWSILESMGDGVVVADRESDFQLMNRAARRMLNVAEGSNPDVRSANWTLAFGVRIYRPDQVTPYPHEELPLIQAINGRTVTRADLYLVNDADQRETWLSVTARPVVDEAGGVHGGVTVWRDSTERKQAERELRDSEALYQSLVENLPMCVVRKDPRGRYVFANRRFRELVNKNPQDILGQTDFDFYPQMLARKLHEDDLRVMKSGTLSENVEEHQLLGSPPMYVETRKTVVQDSQAEVIGLQCIFWDVTPRIRAQHDREEMQRKILQSERLAAIGQMVAGVAHESRNALQKIEACTQLLRWRLNGSAGAEEEELISDVQQAQQRLLRLFEDLRGYSAPLRLERRWCDISDVMHKAWESATSTTNGQKAMLEESKLIQDLRIMADPFQLEQAFRNLFENSLSACAGQAYVQVEFDEVQDNTYRALRVRVRDNGPGLSPEAKVHLFEPFFTTKAEGTGLGTAIIHRIVTAHDGRVELEEDGQPGVVFRIILPREES